MKNKLYAFALVVFFAGAGLFGDESASVFFKMQDAYASGFYPGAVRFADELLKDKKNSLYFFRANLLKAESLFKMGNAKDALKILRSVDDGLPRETLLKAKRYYWLGRCYFELKDYDKASQCFYRAEELLKDDKSEGSEKLFVHSVYFSGKTEYARKNYSQAWQCFEFVLKNANELSFAEYEESSLLLVECLFLDKKFEQAQKYAEVLRNENFSLQTRSRLTLNLANALEEQKKNDLAYEYYAQLFAEDSLSFAKSDFWTGLAIDSFEAGDLKKSLSYFEYAQKNASVQEKQLSLLYRAEILFLTSKKDLPVRAKEALDEINKNWKDCRFEEEKFYYENAMLLRARFAGFAGLWKESFEYADIKPIPKNLEETALYWKSNALYNLGEYTKALSLLEGGTKIENPQLCLLKANLLARAARYGEADKLFYELDSKKLLDFDGNLDYAKSLLSAGYLISTLEQSQKVLDAGKTLTKKQESEAQYLKAISLFNKKDWSGAEEAFKNSLLIGALDVKSQNYALFYLGYSQYQSAKYEQAYLNLRKFAKENAQTSLSWQALVTASRSALQTKKYTEALSLSKEAMDSSVNEQQKQESTFLSVGILSDLGRYDEALSILEKNYSTRGEFGYQCRFLAAEIMVQKKAYAQAQNIYLTLSKEVKAGSLAQEAGFRLGELLYTQKDYAKALDAFEDYIKNYRNGKFYLASLYFAADCLVNLGNKEKAILYYEQVAKNSERSTYTYPATQKLEELLTKNSPSLIAEKEAEYEKLGKTTTVQGRRVGTELSELYKKSGESEAKIEKLSGDLLEIQKKNEAESEYAAKNALILAELYRSQLKNEKAANMYLMSSQYSRKAGLNSLTERSLYGAAEAFDAAGLKGDCIYTVQTLKQLYPSSPYVLEADKLLKN